MSFTIIKLVIACLYTCIVNIIPYPFFNIRYKVTILLIHFKNMTICFNTLKSYIIYCYECFLVFCPENYIQNYEYIHSKSETYICLAPLSIQIMKFCFTV